MKDTKVTVINLKEELDEFLKNNDVLLVQAVVISSLTQSVLRDGGAIIHNKLVWNVWHK